MAFWDKPTTLDLPNRLRGTVWDMIGHAHEDYYLKQEVDEWCRENLKRRYQFTRELISFNEKPDPRSMWGELQVPVPRMKFWNEADALHFKMMWF